MAFDFSMMLPQGGIMNPGSEGMSPEQNKMMMLGLLSNAFTNIGNLGAGRPQESPMQGLLAMQSMYGKQNKEANRAKKLQEAFSGAMVRDPVAGGSVGGNWTKDPATAQFMAQQAQDINGLGGQEPATIMPEVKPMGDPRLDMSKAMQNLMDSGDPDLMMAGFENQLKLTQRAEPRTAEQKNFEYAQTLPEGLREQFMARSQGPGSMPATVQEWEYFNKLPPNQQAQYLEMKRNPQIMNLGGTQAVRAPGGGIGESYAVTPKPTDMPEFQAAQETAKVTARETVQRGAEATSNLPKVQASAANARNMVQGLLNHPGFSSTVGMTMMPGARFIPGTKEADFQSRMDQLKGSAFLQAFETLKGGGQITEVEGKKATDAINRMSISTSEAEFKAAAADFLSVVDRAEQNAVRAAKPTQQPANRVLDRGEILNVELQDALARGDAQNAELIRQEMRRMNVREPAKQPAKQSAGKSFDLPPNAKQYEGKTLRDTKSGKRFKSVGGKWVEVK